MSSSRPQSEEHGAKFQRISFSFRLRDNTIKMWDRATLSCLRVLNGHTGSVLCLQYDDKVIISGSSDSTVSPTEWSVSAALSCHIEIRLS